MKRKTRNLLIIIPIVAYFFYFVCSQQMKIYQLNQEISKVQQEIDKTRDDTEKITAKQVDTTKKKYVEKKARQDSDLVYPNEIIYQLEE